MCKLLVRYRSGEFRNEIDINDNKWYKVDTKISCNYIVLTIHITNISSETLIFESLEELFNSFDIRYIRSEDTL